MEYSLKRLLLYTNKEEKEEFGLPEDVLRVFYGLFVTSKVKFPYSKVSFTQVFNEVFYILTCIHVDKNSPEYVSRYLNDDIFIKIDEDIYQNPDERECSVDEEERISYNRHQSFLVTYYIFSFVWMAISMYQNPPEHVHYFLVGLEAIFKSGNNPYYDEFKVYLRSHPAKIVQPFRICPLLDIDVMFRPVEEWKEVTSDFDKIVVSNIICRFEDAEDRRMLVDKIKQVLSEDNENPQSSSKISKITNRLKANNTFLDELLKQKEEEDKQVIEKQQEIEKSKDEQIKELKKQIADLREENQKVIHAKETAEFERDKYRDRLDALIKRSDKKYIPAELKSKDAELIINELINHEIITPLGHNNGMGFEVKMYRWNDTGALFGYFVDRMNYQLELADSGGRINWKPFKLAFLNYEEKEKRARDTVSSYSKHPKTIKKPEKAEIIDNAIKDAELKIKNGI